MGQVHAGARAAAAAGNHLLHTRRDKHSAIRKIARSSGGLWFDIGTAD